MPHADSPMCIGCASVVTSNDALLPPHMPSLPNSQTFLGFAVQPCIGVDRELPYFDTLEGQFTE